MLTIQESAYENQQRQIAHKERLIEKFRAKASKAKFAKALQKELDRMEQVELDETDTRAMKLRFAEGARPGRVAYKLNRVRKAFGSKTVIHGLNLTVDSRTRIAFVGQNGQGKTTLARMLAGVLEPDSGSLETGHNIQCSYYAQDQPDRLSGTQRVLDVIREAAPAETEGRLRTVLGSMLFSGDDVEKKCSVLSGGERARLAFACMLMTPSNVMILDEPTNHLDILSKEILKQALMQYSGTLIVVSHDVHFLKGLTTSTLEFRDGGIAHRLYDISEFLARRELEDLKALEKSTHKSGTSRQPAPDIRQSGKAKKHQQRQIQNLEREIQKLEIQKKEIEGLMSDGTFFARADAQETTARYQQLCKTLEEKTRLWEDLVSEYEA
jgi:ATP-binding cassette subfamily F protein 3